ncbi:MAG: deoxyribose-phosphate aldolase [Bacteroidales bacterium]|nr:deoxyribose-phosphate aldolase [Bacteroidales bacterium]MCF8404921.1 deoxyribose-phosphate aldolase [Bacteroidales bacterium]
MENVKTGRTPLVEFPPDEMKKLIQSFSLEKLASFLDVTDLNADTQAPKMKKMVDWARTYGCASVCVNPVEGADILPELCKGSGIKECYVIDFPLGKVDIELKAEMTSHTVNKSRAIRNEGKGNIELDMVINVGRFKKDHAYTLEEINAVCDAADGEHVKVIVRSSELTEKEIYEVSEIVASSRADFIKNSTGMDAYGATPEHIHIMREVVGNEMGVKAAGGISDVMTAMRLFYAGAREEKLQTPELFRLGTSKPLNILSSFGWLIHSTEDWINAGIIPCTICPYNFTSKLRVELREESNAKCRSCKFKEYRKHKEF